MFLVCSAWFAWTKGISTDIVTESLDFIGKCPLFDLQIIIKMNKLKHLNQSNLCTHSNVGERRERSYTNISMRLFGNLHARTHQNGKHSLQWKCNITRKQSNRKPHSPHAQNMHIRNHKRSTTATRKNNKNWNKTHTHTHQMQSNKRTTRTPTKKER